MISLMNLESSHSEVVNAPNIANSVDRVTQLMTIIKIQIFMIFVLFYVNPQAPITTTADDKFCYIFPDFQKNKA